LCFLDQQLPLIWVSSIAWVLNGWIFDLGLSLVMRIAASPDLRFGPMKKIWSWVFLAAHDFRVCSAEKMVSPWWGFVNKFWGLLPASTRALIGEEMDAGDHRLLLSLIEFGS
ncbi:hypothetical protein ACLOJK_022326, partial [Asimina triloba]